MTLQERAVVRNRFASGARLVLVTLVLATVLPNVIGFLSPIIFTAIYHSRFEVALAVKQTLAVNALLHAAVLTLIAFGAWRLHDATARVEGGALRRVGLLTFVASAGLVALTWIHGVRRFLQGSTPVPSPTLQLATALGEALFLLSLSVLLYLFARLQLSKRVCGWAWAAGISVALGIVLELVPVDDPQAPWLVASLLVGLAQGLCVFVALALTLRELRSPPMEPGGS